MGFTEEDRVVIKSLRQKNATALGAWVKELSLKNWKIGTWKELLNKIDDNHSDNKHFMFTSQIDDYWLVFTVSISLLLKFLKCMPK